MSSDFIPDDLLLQIMNRTKPRSEQYSHMYCSEESFDFLRSKCSEAREEMIRNIEEGTKTIQEAEELIQSAALSETNESE